MNLIKSQILFFTQSNALKPNDWIHIENVENENINDKVETVTCKVMKWWKMLKSSIKLCIDSINSFFFSQLYTCRLYWLKTPSHAIHRFEKNNKIVIRMRILPSLSFTFRWITTQLPHSLTFTLQAFEEETVYFEFQIHWQKAFHRIGHFFFLSFWFHFMDDEIESFLCWIANHHQHSYFVSFKIMGFACIIRFE